MPCPVNFPPGLVACAAAWAGRVINIGYSWNIWACGSNAATSGRMTSRFKTASGTDYSGAPCRSWVVFDLWRGAGGSICRPVAPRFPAQLSRIGAPEQPVPLRPDEVQISCSPWAGCDRIPVVESQVNYRNPSSPYPQMLKCLRDGSGREMPERPDVVHKPLQSH